MTVNYTKQILSELTDKINKMSDEEFMNQYGELDASGNEKNHSLSGHYALVDYCKSVIEWYTFNETIRIENSEAEEYESMSISSKTKIPYNNEEAEEYSIAA